MKKSITIRKKIQILTAKYPYQGVPKSAILTCELTSVDDPNTIIKTEYVNASTLYTMAQMFGNA